MQPSNPPNLEALRRRARTVSPGLRIGRAGLTDGVIDMARRLLARDPLLKVRFLGHDRNAVRDAVDAVVRGVPCRLVSLTGFSAVFCSIESAEHPTNDLADGTDAEVT